MFRNITRNNIKNNRLVFFTLLTVLVPGGFVQAATNLIEENFDVAPQNWAIGSQKGGEASISVDTNLNYKNSKGSLKASYPVATGGVYAWATINIASWNATEVYIDFWAKMPKAKHGLKFLKVFGGSPKGTDPNYANTTFALDYTGRNFGGMYQVSFGDGTSVKNDTQNAINFDGSRPEIIGRSYGTAVVSTPQNKIWDSANWGSDWHHFRMRVKFNSGTTADTEVADGAYSVEIDGVEYVNATGLLNRHYSNMPIERIELLGWSQNGSEPFEIWYDNITITDGTQLKSVESVGQVQQSAPVQLLPPNNVRVQKQ